MSVLIRILYQAHPGAEYSLSGPKAPLTTKQQPSSLSESSVSWPLPAEFDVMTTEDNKSRYYFSGFGHLSHRWAKFWVPLLSSCPLQLSKALELHHSCSSTNDLIDDFSTEIFTRTFLFSFCSLWTELQPQPGTEQYLANVVICVAIHSHWCTLCPSPLTFCCCAPWYAVCCWTVYYFLVYF